MDAYARCGVREVWIVTPWPHCVEVFALDGSSYRRHAVSTENDTLVPAAFPALRLDLAPVFRFPLEPGEKPPVVREPPGRYAASDPTT